jgi:hypothetical protein
VWFCRSRGRHVSELSNSEAIIDSEVADENWDEPAFI